MYVLHIMEERKKVLDQELRSLKGSVKIVYRIQESGQWW